MRVVGVMGAVLVLAACSGFRSASLYRCSAGVQSGSSMAEMLPTSLHRPKSALLGPLQLENLRAHEIETLVGPA